MDFILFFVTWEIQRRISMRKIHIIALMTLSSLDWSFLFLFHEFSVILIFDYVLFPFSVFVGNLKTIMKQGKLIGELYDMVFCKEPLTKCRI